MAEKVTSERVVALDGLRGIAILLVILFHLDLGLDPTDTFAAVVSRFAKCGWIGVDVFFVLSGFLITGILLDSKASPNYYRTFYARRILRIFPLYYLTLAVVFLLIPWFLTQKSERLQFLLDKQLWFWTFLSNVGYVVERRAFGNADWLWMDHFWSLALEEQFYFVWPFIVRQLNHRRIIQVSLALMVCSLLIRIGLASIGMRPSALYFPTPCRLDGLAVGSILATLKRFPGTFVSFRSCMIIFYFSAAVLLGILVVRGGLHFDDISCLTIGLSAISIVSGGVVCWASEAKSGIGANLIRSRFLVATGKYSFGMYVLHHLLLPLLFLNVPAKFIASHTGSSAIATILLIILVYTMSACSGVVSWHLIEKHFLKLKRQFMY